MVVEKNGLVTGKDWSLGSPIRSRILGTRCKDQRSTGAGRRAQTDAMKAFEIQRFGEDGLVLVERPDPVPGLGQAAIPVLSC